MMHFNSRYMMSSMLLSFCVQDDLLPLRGRLQSTASKAVTNKNVTSYEQLLLKLTTQIFHIEEALTLYNNVK